MQLTCPDCGFTKDLGRSDLPAGSSPGGSWVVCPKCGRKFPPYPEAPEEPEKPLPQSPHAQGDVGIPWESTEIPLFKAWSRTVLAAMFHPGALYDHFQPGRPVRPAVTFGLVSAAVGCAFTIFWFWALFMLIGLFDPWSPAGADPLGFSRVVPVLLTLSPVWGAALMFTWAGLTHLFLIIVRGARAEWRGSLWVFGFAAAGWAVAVVPLVGSAAGLIWGVVITIRGLIDIHRIGPWRVVLVMFVFPLILTLLSLMVLVQIWVSRWHGLH